jgi:DNA modification methylase
MEFNKLPSQFINQVLHGNNLEILKMLPDNSVDCVVTSPPYYGLRDYGTANWVGGDPECKHKSKKMKPGTDNNRRTTLTGGHKTQIEAKNIQQKDICDQCGAVRKDDQVGIEPTPEAYVARIVEIFEEVRRVLKPTGTLWLNLGDSYFGGGGAAGQKPHHTNFGKPRSERSFNTEGITRKSKSDTLKPKDLIGIPWMVAFALRDAGWYLRSDILWVKPNPMPESVQDRPSKAHEYIFLLSKSQKYYYDAEAIRVPPTQATIERMSQQIEAQKGSNRAVGKTNGPMKAVGPGKNIRSGVDTRGGNQGNKKGIPALPDRAGSGTPYAELSKTEQQSGGANKKTTWKADDPLAVWKWFYDNFPADLVDPLFEQYFAGGTDMTDVWEVATKPFKEAHFATYPEDLIHPCIKAGTSEYGCCDHCGKPYERVTEPVFDVKHTGDTDSAYDEKSTAGRLAKLRQAAREHGKEYSAEKKTVGWQAACKCKNAGIVPAIVLDLFDGARTTLVAAKRLGRNFLGIELNSEYIKIGNKRMINEFGNRYSMFENKDFYEKK